MAQHGPLASTARRPDLVRGLIVVEASPDSGPGAASNARKWLDSWPVPFPTLADAREFFGGDTLWANTWLEVLKECDDGFRPQFNLASMEASMRDVESRDYWAEWRAVRCPTLVVGGERGFFRSDVLPRMATELPCGRFLQVAEAGHDLHLERPVEWRAAVEGFLTREMGGL